MSSTSREPGSPVSVASAFERRAALLTLGAPDADWKKSTPKMHVKGTSTDPTPDDAPRQHDVVCEHGKLQPDVKKFTVITDTVRPSSHRLSDDKLISFSMYRPPPFSAPSSRLGTPSARAAASRSARSAPTSRTRPGRLLRRWSTLLRRRG